MKFEDFRIRDPFILPDAGKYYLYGTTDKNVWEGKGEGFAAYVSADLNEWDGPFPVFRPRPDFWGTMHFWAPEVHLYHGEYYMFASFKAEGACRGTQILKADHPLGSFQPISEGPVTPRDRECLDGTLYLGEGGKPYIVFCHEWLQIRDGAICAMPLSDDLTRAEGEPVTLFHGSDAPWKRVKKPGEREIYVTDGPFLHKMGDGGLLMLWSSGGNNGYAMGMARSDGGICGPWRQIEQPLFDADGGHGMVFRTFDGRLMATLHRNNGQAGGDVEHAVALPVTERDGKLALA